MTVPLLQAILVADHIYHDKGTGKYVVCGIFNVLYFKPQKPADGEDQEDAEPESTDEGFTQRTLHDLVAAGSPFVYMNMTEVQGEKSFQLRYVDLSDNQVMFETAFRIKCDDPLQNVEIGLPLPRLPRPHEGVFALELLCDGQLLGSHRVQTKIHPHTTE